jgi:hypothetical protein
VTANELTGIEEIVKIRAPVHGICGRRYTDPTKLIFVIIKEISFIYFIEWCPFKFTNNIYDKRLNSKARAGDLNHS